MLKTAFCGSSAPTCKNGVASYPEGPTPVFKVPHKIENDLGGALFVVDCVSTESSKFGEGEGVLASDSETDNRVGFVLRDIDVATNLIPREETEHLFGLHLVVVELNCLLEVLKAFVEESPGLKNLRGLRDAFNSHKQGTVRSVPPLSYIVIEPVGATTPAT